MSSSCKVFTALSFSLLNFSLLAFAGERGGASLTSDVASGASHGEEPQTASRTTGTPSTPMCPSLFSLSTEFAPNVSFVKLTTTNIPNSTIATGSLAGFISGGATCSLAGIGVKQSFGYGQSLRLNLNGAYSEVLSGATDSGTFMPSIRGRAFDAVGEVAISLAADDDRRVCFEPFAGYAFFDMRMTASVQTLVQAGRGGRATWDHLRYYGPMVGLGLSLLPAETLRISAKIGYIRSHLWDKNPSEVTKGKNRFRSIVSSMRLDYNVTASISTHASIGYQGWSAQTQYTQTLSGVSTRPVSVVPYLRRVIIGFGVKVAY